MGESKLILVATFNPHKLEEIRSFIKAAGLDSKFIIEGVKGKVDSFPEETGESFEENALIKSRYIKQKFKDASVLSDDSGLEVLSLGYRPGVRSSRYSDLGTDEANNEKLLKELQGFLPQDRKARFCSVLSYIDESGSEFIYRGYCYGTILNLPQGSSGFGYDPLFYIPELSKTMAELTLDEKNRVSHRALALCSWLNDLKRLK